MTSAQFDCSGQRIAVRGPRRVRRTIAPIPGAGRSVRHPRDRRARSIGPVQAGPTCRSGRDAETPEDRPRHGSTNIRSAFGCETPGRRGWQRALVDRLLRRDAQSALSGAPLTPAQMLVIERKRGFRSAAGSGGMQQPDRPRQVGLRFPRFRETSNDAVGSSAAGTAHEQRRRRNCWNSIKAGVSTAGRRALRPRERARRVPLALTNAFVAKRSPGGQRSARSRRRLCDRPPGAGRMAKATVGAPARHFRDWAHARVRRGWRAGATSLSPLC
jgi:hypothetical protein